MGHLGQSTEITTIQDKEIVLTSSDGHTFKMKVTDLAEAVRQVMPVATSEKSGLMSANDRKQSERFSFFSDTLERKVIKLCSNTKNSFSGILKLFYYRNESTSISEFNVYVNSYKTTNMSSFIQVKQTAGSLSCPVFRDNNYFYLVIDGTYKNIFINVERVLYGSLDPSYEDVDISTLTPVTLS